MLKNMVEMYYNIYQICVIIIIHISCVNIETLKIIIFKILTYNDFDIIKIVLVFLFIYFYL